MGNPKGNKGEREVANLLTQWWLPFEPMVGDEPLKFVRTPMSGGWQHGPTFQAAGDIMTNSVKFAFAVEVKRREQWSLNNLLAGRPSPVWGYWRQCQRDAQSMGREPMLWFRQNRKPWMVMLRYGYIARIKGAKPPDVIWPERLKLAVDCQARPVVYLAKHLLTHDPSVFSRKGK